MSSSEEEEEEGGDKASEGDSSEEESSSDDEVCGGNCGHVKFGMMQLCQKFHLLLGTGHSFLLCLLSIFGVFVFLREQS